MTGATALRPGQPQEEYGAVARAYARVVVALRFVLILVWIGLAVAATTLPAISSSGADGGIDGFVGQDNPTVATEIASARAFGFPLLSRTVMVQHDPQGLGPFTQAEATLRAIALTQGSYPEAYPILGALPVVNTLGVFPGATAQGTTAITYLFLRPGAGFSQQTAAAYDFADRRLQPEDAFVGVTGSIPARVEQGGVVSESLPLVELATLAAIVVIVGLNFRSVAAPAIALGTSAIAFVVATRLTGLGGDLLGISIPTELEPLILALILGVTTDYAIFFLSGMRYHLSRGAGRLDAARAATAQFGPIVAVAGLTVAAGTAALLVAESPFFRAFGPAMALAVAVSLVVSVTLVPALIAVLGRGAFWPLPPSPPRSAAEEATSRRPGPLHRGRAVRLMTFRPVALVVVLACTAGLVLATLPIRDLELGVGFTSSLPDSNRASVASAAAAEGFAPGIIAPTVLLVQDDGVTGERASLSGLGARLRAQPGVAGVLGPGDLVPELEEGVLLADSGDAARFLVILDDEPLGATAIRTLDALERALPALLDDVGLGTADWGLGGDTALAAGLVSSTQDDLGRIATAALLVNLLMLVLFLRALIAPLYLLACSVLALGAALGLTTYVFQDLLGHDGLTFYVPFAASVLLIALGSDYNIFGVGHIWGLARGRPLREAIIEAVPQTTRAITAAGITLAASFGMLALVPLRPFRELAFVMAVGILLDSVVVRSFLVPTLLSLVGRFSGWPGSALSGAKPVTPSDPSRSLDALQHTRS